MNAILTKCDITGRFKTDPAETGWLRLPNSDVDVCPEKASMTLAEYVEAKAPKPAIPINPNFGKPAEGAQTAPAAPAANE